MIEGTVYIVSLYVTCETRLFSIFLLASAFGQLAQS